MLFRLVRAFRYALTLSRFAAWMAVKRAVPRGVWACAKGNALKASRPAMANARYIAKR